MKTIEKGLFKYCSELTSVVIDETVTCIGESAFEGCNRLKNINFRGTKEQWDKITKKSNWDKNTGDYTITYNYTGENNLAQGLAYTINKDGETCTITGIGSCTDTNLIIPNEIDGYKVTKIGAEAFCNTKGILSVEISDGVTEIGEKAFYNCSLISIIIPDSVMLIGKSAFSNSSISSVVIPNGVTAIEEQTFNGCKNLYSVVIGSGITSIGKSAFADTALLSLDIPNNVQTIGDLAFTNCKFLTTVLISDGVTSVGVGAFSNCTSLTKVVIGEGVVSIGKSAFTFSPKLTNIEVSVDNKFFSSIAGNLYDKNVTKLIQYCVAKNDTTIDIPNTVTTIGSYACYQAKSLTSLDIPDNVKNIEEYAFSYCENLTSIVIGNGVTDIGDYAFISCLSLDNFVIGNSVVNIGNYAFASVGIKSLVIPDRATLPSLHPQNNYCTL